mmetsp:Transcript_3630/g.6897  ORF Transcript_3630/g.6897 Transcript_3630/m.6897 type:complete len:323 (-) Transcript_3630:1395-2363(-)
MKHPTLSELRNMYSKLGTSSARDSSLLETTSPPVSLMESKARMAEELDRNGSGWTERWFRWWTRLRVGDGRPVLWYGEGELSAVATGRILARMEGLEAMVAVGDKSVEDEHEVMASACRVIAFRDPDTGNYMENFRFRPKSPPRAVELVEVPEQLVRFRWRKRDGDLWMSAVSRAPPNAERASTEGKTIIQTSTRRVRIVSPPRSDELGATSLTFAFHTTAETKRRGGASAVWEQFQYRTNLFARPTMSWTRVGQCPSWYGPWQCVMSMRAKQVHRMGDIPKSLRRFLEERGSQFLSTPSKDLPSELLSDPARPQSGRISIK